MQTVFKYKDENNINDNILRHELHADLHIANEKKEKDNRNNRRKLNRIRQERKLILDRKSTVPMSRMSMGAPPNYTKKSFDNYRTS